MTDETLAEIQQAPTAAGKLQIFSDVFSELASVETVINVFIDFYAETRHDEEITAILKQMLIPYIDLIAEIVQGGMSSGEFKPVDPRAMAMIFMAASEGLMLYRTVLTSEFDWRQVGQLFASTFLAGLRIEQPPGSEP